MTKKNISRILQEGTPKQRILLLTEHIARNNIQHPELKEGGPLLTEEEFNALTNSFKTEKELRLYNKFRQTDAIVLQAINNLQGQMFEVNMHFSNLRGYILVFDTIAIAEQMANTALHEIKDQKERKRIAGDMTLGGAPIFTHITVDKEGYLNLETDYNKTKQSPSLKYVMNNVKGEATRSVIKFLSWKKAIQDYMKETGFNVRTYLDLMDYMTAQINGSIVPWHKYLSDIKTFKPGAPITRADKLKENNNMAPDMTQLEADKDIYNYFKDRHLAYE